MKSDHMILTVVIAASSHAVACDHRPTPQSVCHALEKEAVAEGCKDGAPPLFSVPRHGSQWTFHIAAGEKSADSILGKGEKPSGGVIQFESIDDRDVTVRYLNGLNSVLPAFEFIHRLQNPPMLVIMKKEGDDNAVRTHGLLDRLYGYDK